MPNRRIYCRSGSPACIPISAAAIRRSESGLSKYPLLWMIDEAVKCGLAVDQRTVNALAWGRQRKGSPFSYVAPDAAAELHNSLNGAWWMLEFLPKADQVQGMAGAKVACSDSTFRTPSRARFRKTPSSMNPWCERMEAVKDYRPVNMPARYETFPMPQASEQMAAAGA